MIIQGNCLCGGVHYKILGELNDAAYCHCSKCRRTLGAAFAAYARVDTDEFRWVSGEKFIASYESSPSVHRCFCQKCGSSLGVVVGEGSRLNWVSLGTVKGNPEVRSEAHLFVGSKAPWHEITDDLPQFDEWPPVTSEFYQRFS